MKKLLLPVLIGLLSATAVAQVPAAATETKTSGPVLLKNPRTDGFRLWPGDVIEVKFFFNKDLNETVQVRPDGRIMMPIVGEVEVGNHTVAEACAELEERTGKSWRHYEAAERGKALETETQ